MNITFSRPWKVFAIKKYMQGWEKKNNKGLIWPKYNHGVSGDIYHVNWVELQNNLELWNAFLWRVLEDIQNWIQKNKKGEFIVHYVKENGEKINLKLIRLMGIIDADGVIHLNMVCSDALYNPYYINGNNTLKAYFYLERDTLIPFECEVVGSDNLPKNRLVVNLESYFKALNTKNGFIESGFRFDTFGKDFNC